MAKRSYSNKMTKIQPAVTTMVFTYDVPVTAPGATTTNFIDLSQVASIMNRRFYRQGINWAVAGFKVFNVDGTSGSIGISKLPNTWVMSNSWEKSFRTWTRMNNEALEESPSIKPKFLDFKIYADAKHHTDGFSANLLPLTAAGFATAGEWESSKISYPDSLAPGLTGEAEFIATGANYPGPGASLLNAVSLIEGYAASRGLPNILDPNTPTDAESVAGPFPENWMSAIFNEGTDQTEEIILDMVSENNIAPYPFENDGVNNDTMYPGGANQLTGLQIHDAEFFTPTTISNIVRLKGGSFPCGLIRIDSVNSGLSTSTFQIYLDLVPGTHRGYMCQPMTEM